MSTVADLLQELEAEAPATRRVLAAIPTDRLSWRPHERSRTMGELALHVAVLPHVIVEATLQPRFDPGARQPSAVPASTEEIVKAFDDAMEYARATLGSMPDADLDKPWTLVRGERVLAELPRRAGYRMILLNHAYHHRGQLTVYLRLNDVPVPSVYGPTADEPIFGKPD